MSVFDDLSNFLETRLEEFLRSNPHLELQALLEQLQEQEQDTLKLIAQLQLEEKRLQDQILALAQDIQTWHSRITKAKEAGRLDLASAAQEREATLLRQGNQLWGQRLGVEKRLIQARELFGQIRQRRKEVKVRADQVKNSQTNTQTTGNSETIGWNRTGHYSGNSKAYDPLDEQFKQWEMDDEIGRMKRDLGL
jgi:uncharacterized protein (TIGR04376 family)